LAGSDKAANQVALSMPVKASLSIKQARTEDLSESIGCVDNAERNGTIVTTKRGSANRQCTQQIAPATKI